MIRWTLGARSHRPRSSPCRTCLRASVAVPARVVPAHASDVEQSRAVVENLSDRGSQLRSAKVFREGDRVRLSLRPGTDARLTLEGEVVYAHGRRFQTESLYGLRFVELSEGQSAALADYVRELMRSQFMRSPRRASG